MWSRVVVDVVVPPGGESAEWCVATGQLEVSCVVSLSPIGVVGVPVVLGPTDPREVRVSLCLSNLRDIVGERMWSEAVVDTDRRLGGSGERGWMPCEVHADSAVPLPLSPPASCVSRYPVPFRGLLG